MRKIALEQAHVNLLSEEQLLVRLRDVLKRKGVSLRSLSKDLGVPYRSVQNYVGGETRMPASFLLNVCAYVGLEPSFLYRGDFRPSWPDLYDAVFQACKVLNALPPDEFNLGTESSHAGGRPQVNFVGRATEIVSENYDRFRHEWLSRRNPDFGMRGDPFIGDLSAKGDDQPGLPVSGTVNRPTDGGLPDT